MSTQYLGLRTSIYKVADILKAKTWYAKILGVKPYFDEVFYVGFNVAGYELGLQPEEKPTDKKSESVLTYWGVKDAHKTFNELLEAGATAHEQPMDVGGGIIVATVKDPWGNIFGIIDNPHFKAAEEKDQSSNL
jgi:predicted enzyme related to lactoylglutathione lyase